MDKILVLLIFFTPSFCLALIGIRLEWLIRRRGPGPSTDALGFLSAFCWIFALMALAVSLLMIFAVFASSE